MLRKLAVGIVATLTLIAAAGVHASVVVHYGNLVYRNAAGATAVLTETGADGNPAMFPDGNLIAFTRLRSGEQEHPEIASSGPLRDVYVIRLPDRAVTKIVSSFNAKAMLIKSTTHGCHAL